MLKLYKTFLSIMNGNSVKKGDVLKIYVDGASRGNPGPAASAFLFIHNDSVIHEEYEFIGTATNNTAEYQAIINALKVAEKFSRGHIQVYSDSNLAVQQ
ncbi:MAG: ribonuclease HI family protein, partial [Candidatus Heimdallarchaeota archaeon]